MFEIGNVVFYPVFGAGLIINIEDKIIGDKVNKYYIINFIKNNMNIMIPVLKCDSKIRLGIKKSSCKNIFDILKDNGQILPDKWCERVKIYNETIKQGDIYKLAAVLKSISKLSHVKNISKSEKRYFNDILEMIAGEISLVNGNDIIKVKDDINHALVKAD